MKKILIITYYWPPSGGPGVQRWLKFSKYLPEFGYDPIIITVDPEKAEYPIKDYTLEQDVRADQIVYRTDCSGLYEYYKKLTKAPSAPYSGFVNEGAPSLKQKIARFIRGNFFLPDARRGWNKHAYHQAIQIIQEEKIDAVITGLSSHAGASPQDGHNAILAACSATLAMHTACQDSRGAARLNVGTISGGTGRNVVADRAVLQLETRGETTEIERTVFGRAMSSLKGAAEMFGCTVDTKIMGSASSADSSAELEPFIRAGAARVPEITNYVKEAAFSGSEDATYLMAKVQSHGRKAAYMCIGSNIAAPHHNDHFNFDESSLLTGLRLYVSTVWEIMHR